MAAANGTDFIAKPFTPATLINKVRRITSTIERRVAERVTPPEGVACRIAFSSTAIYAAELINISITGCLLRTAPFRQGDAIYDMASVTLKLGNSLTALKASLVRAEADRATGGNGSPHVQAAFHFVDGDGSDLEAIRNFIVQYHKLHDVAPPAY